MIRIQEVRDWKAVEPHARAWNELAQRSEEATVFQCFEWHAAWWKVFQAEYELRLLLAWSGERLVGIAPWMIGRKSKLLQFIGSGDDASDYCDLLVDPSHPEALEAMSGWLFRNASAWRRLEFRNFPSDSRQRQQFERHLRGGSSYVFLDRPIEAPTRVLGNAAADGEAVNKGSLQKYFKQLQKSGRVDFVHLESPQEIEPLLDVFFQQHIERRALTGTPSQFLDPKQKQLYRELVRTLAPAGALKFGVLSLDGAPVAFHFGFEYKSRFVYYKPTFSTQHARKSPGKVLLKFLLQDAIDRGLREFDFSVGAEPYKYQFANRVRTNHRMQVFSFALGYWLHQGKKAAKRLLRRPKELFGRSQPLAPRTADAHGPRGR